MKDYKSYTGIGWDFAVGAYMFVAISLLAGSLLSSGWEHFFPRPTDSTDYDTKHRSGFTVMTDYETGCQYLRHGGTIIPRLYIDGQPMCVNRKKPNV